MLLAHAAGGGALPAPTWLLSYIGIACMVLTAVALRSSWPSARLNRFAPTDRTAEGDHATVTADGPAGPTIGQGIGIVLLGLAFATALGGPTAFNEQAGNIAPVAVTIVWWVSLPILVLLVGDVMAAINPFVGIVSLVERVRPDRSPAAPPPAWVPAVFLGCFAWYLLAYYRPGSPRALALFLAVYTAAAIAAGLRWGSAWLRTGEGFGALSASIARFSLRPSRTVVPGAAALMVAWLGGVLFDGISITDFWVTDVLGATRGWGRTGLNTLGLVWMTAIAGGVVLLAFRFTSTASTPSVDGDVDDAGPADPRSALAARVGLAFVPLAVGWFIAHDLSLLLAAGQDFLALLSDPFGRGWDLFGTINRTPWYGWVDATWLGWVQVVAILVGHVAAVVVGHDLAIRLLGRRAGMTVTWAIAFIAAVSISAAALLVLE